MGRLNIIVKGKLRPYTDIVVDNQILKLKKIKKQKSYSATYETSNETVELSIKEYYHLQTKLWFLQEMFFFIISIFGIFDLRFSKNSYITNCKIKVNVENETEIDLKLVAPLNNGEVVKCENVAGIDIIENTYKIDNITKKRKKILKVSKIFTVIIAVILMIILIV